MNSFLEPAGRRHRTQTMAAWYWNNRRRRERIEDSSGGGGPGPDPTRVGFVGSYYSIYSQGWRWSHAYDVQYGRGEAGNGLMPGNTASANLIAQETYGFAPSIGMSNGAYNSSQGPYWNNFTPADNSYWIEFDFADPIAMCGMRSIGGDARSYGRWIPQYLASDNVTWVALTDDTGVPWTVSSTFFPDTNYCGTQTGAELLWDNPDKVKANKWRLVAAIGYPITNGHVCAQVEFKVMAHPLCGGARTGITIGGVTQGSPLTDRNGRAFACAFDGYTSSQNGYIGNSGINTLNPGDYIEFGFPTAVCLRQMVIVMDQNVQEAPSAQSTWHWQYDAGGGTFVTAGSAFVAGNRDGVNGGRCGLYDGGFRSGAVSKTWRLVKNSSDNDNLYLGFSEIQFDLGTA